MERDKPKKSESVGQTLLQLPWGFKKKLDSFHQTSWKFVGIFTVVCGRFFGGGEGWKKFKMAAAKYKNPPIWTKFGFQVDNDVANWYSSLVYYGGHFDSKMSAKIQKSSNLGEIWFLTTMKIFYFHFWFTDKNETRVAAENRVGRVTVNRHFFFFHILIV